MSRIGRVTLAYCVGAFASASTFVVAQDPKAGSHSYRYFKESIPLGCTLDRVALFEKAGVADAAGKLRSCAARSGISGSGLRKADVPTLWWADLAGVKEAKDVESKVASLAKEQDLGFASPVLTDALGQPVLVTQFLHVGFAQAVNPAQATGILRSHGAGQVVAQDWSGMPGVYRVQCASRDGFEVLALANRLAALAEVVFAEPDMIMTVQHSLIPNDPLFPQQWGLHNTGQSGGTVDMDMDAPEAWDLLTGTPSVVVVILDSGTQQNHPDINQNPGMDFTGSGTGGGPLNQCDNHGTAVSGCTSAFFNNAIGVAGVAPTCKTAAAKWNIATVGTPCPGTGSFQISWFVNALDWALTSGARVTNNSNGFGASATITNKYQQTEDAGLIHFVATGNSGAGTIGYPSSLPSVNAVGAINRFGNKASFSQFGPGIDFSAPGDDIVTTDRTGSAGYVSGDYVQVDGTSFASPYAAGVAALVISADPTLAPNDVELVMQQTCTDRGTPGYDTTFGWGIVNAAGAVLAALPDLTVSGSCFYDAGMTNPVPNLTVEITNLSTSTEYQAGTTGNVYSLDLQVITEINTGDTLRLIAKDDTQYINVTDHLVTQAEIDARSIVLDLVLDEFYLDLADFPMYEADAPDHNEYTGAAVAQMVLNYIWWNSTVDPTPPLTFPDQSVLYTYGINHNATPGLNFIDPVGMFATIQNHRPLPYSQFGYNFSIVQNTDGVEVFKQMAQWIAYEIGTFGGHEPGHPLHVPAATPAYGDYSNWMAVRGIHTNEDAYPLPPSLDVFGFWINDPLPAAFGRIGENSYKTASELLATYFLPLTTGDAYNGKYVAICEPPDDDPEKALNILDSPALFTAEAKATVDSARALGDAADDELVEAANQWVIKAATDGVQSQLCPYDESFARRFDSSVPGAPLPVTFGGAGDYYCVPFEAARTRGVVIVVLVSAEDGSFKEASWVNEPVNYPPISRSDAEKLALKALADNGIRPDLTAATVNLVYRGSTPYYPHWRFATDEYAVYVAQDGQATIEKP